MMNLSPRQKQRLVECLLACPGINESRDTVVAQLPPAIRNSIEQSEHPRVHVLHIMETCINYPWGIEYLLQAIHFLDQGTTQIVALYQELEEIQRKYQSVPSHHLVDLWNLLQDIQPSDDDLRRFFHTSVPAGTALPRACAGMDMLISMLHTLAGMSVAPGKLHPIVTFAAQFIPHTNDPDLQQSITTWIETTAAHLGISDEDIKRLLSARKTERQTPVAFPLYLLIELEPKAESPDCYLVQAWVWCERRKQRIYAEDTPHSLDTIPQLINHLIEAIVDDQLAANNPPAIEFFLPHALLGNEMDQLELEAEETLGVRYSVAVRFRERATNKKYWPAWMNRWNGFPGTQQHQQRLIETVCSSERCTSRALRIRLEEIVCLALTYVLPPGSETQNTLLSLLLRSGTPIALWPRHCTGNPDDIQREIEEMIAGDIFEHLPEVVRQCRQKAWVALDEGNDLPGNHLTLLWDNPNRLPHKNMYLEAPEMFC
jgi:hypothetical protein